MFTHSETTTVSFQRGDWVRLKGDAQRFGMLQDIVDGPGGSQARVKTPTRTVYWPITQIELVPAAREEPLDFLRSGRFAEPPRLRQVLAHIRLTGRLADMIYSMEASNTDFHAYQFKPVLKMLASPTGSILIADEVGLGKTIEAGLIWTELRARFDYRRLLVICPKVLVKKWEAELAGKFGLDARHHTADDLLGVLEERERWSRGFVAVCSLQGVKPPRGWDDENAPGHGRTQAKLARLLQERAEDEPLFDMVVIDEAHHLRNPETQNNRLAQLLVRTAQHLVLLSATPIHLKNDDLFALLSLIDPETYRHPTVFKDIIEANRPIVEAREAALRGTALAELRERLEAASRHHLLAGTQKIGVLLRALEKAQDPLSRPERARLADELETVNLLANTVTRTRRRDVQELRVTRQVHALRAEMAEIEREAYDTITRVVQRYAFQKDVPDRFLLATPQRLLSSCLSAAVEHWLSRLEDFEDEDEDETGTEENGDETRNARLRPLVEALAEVCRRLPSPGELERHDSKFAEFIAALRRFLDDHPSEKVVVFSSFRPTLRYLGRRLRAGSLPCEVIHGEVKDRQSVLARFQSDSTVRILLSSEVGSEGIDLQFCRTVVNYDLPWNPMRVEQRIGRVDRLGQAAESITVLNLLHRGTIDDEIYRRLYERLRLCERALGGFEDLLGEEIAKLTPDLLRGALSPEDVARRLDQTSQAIENRLRMERELEQEAAALIAHGDRITMSIRAAHEMQRWIGAADLASYLANSLSALFPGSSVWDLGHDGLYEVKLTQDARVAYGQWLQDRQLPGGDRLLRETGPVLCRLGKPAGLSAALRGAETVTQTHPFVRFLSERVSDTDAPKLRPAVAARLSASDIRGGSTVGPGLYAVLAMFWRFGGQIAQERIAYAGISLADEEIIPDDDAERLMLAVAECGAMWPEAGAELACDDIAQLCDDRLVARLSDRFTVERDALRAERQDRAAIQRRTLEQRLQADVQRQREIIHRHRVLISRGDGSAAKSKALIAMAEGKIRKLEERAAHRRAAIDRSAEMTEEQEQLALAIIKVEA